MLLTAGSELPVMYFLDKPPSDIRTSTLPTTAKEVLLARVRLLGAAAYRGGRVDRGGHRQHPLPKELLFARLRILEALNGNVAVGSAVDVTFGAIDKTHSLIPAPRTPLELKREYYVLLYAGDGGQWHLAGFPMSEADYRKWEEKFWNDERARMGVNSRQ
ncbi:MULTISPECIES: hypothetical protein [Bradyrhizobium]|uniref:Uncharacterized protein n=1 Tax=Bradyrhizobium frederickii TaxID=2560054 RepID=A0A4Y9KYC1_9BRAD|nr:MULTISPECIES: hypothetical protein [Bradyrhizobium]RTE91115.1 hypothetical protein D6B98_20780 [Bradyrhizobium sp. LVM 105]TFV35477.1 hypothetical protein E4K66_26590 [Bradyrhizobium frederickii]